MVQTLSVLLVWQCLGEVLAYGLGVPVPGPVLGMLGLWGYLALRPSVAAQIRSTVLVMLRHLSLLFVPAGVGVMLHAGLLANEGTAIVAALLVSTALAILVTAFTFSETRKWLARRGNGAGGNGAKGNGVGGKPR